MLAEFKYGGVPDETFAKFGFDQAVPNRCGLPPAPCVSSACPHSG